MSNQIEAKSFLEDNIFMNWLNIDQRVTGHVYPLGCDISRKSLKGNSLFSSLLYISLLSALG